VRRRPPSQGKHDADYAALAVDLIYGSLWYRLIFRVALLDYTWADAALAAAIPPVQPPAID
jgi:hypothetical protein